MMTAIEDARALLPENHERWDCDGSASICDERVNALRALIAEHERLIAEMHQRELHHFETEKLLVEAGIDPDATPPTDDEREALIQALPYIEQGDYNEFADAILAAGFRRQGPINDEWEYGNRWGDREDDVDPAADLSEATRLLDLDDYKSVVRRRPAGPPGPWEPVEAAREA